MNEVLKQKLTERFEAISAKAECDKEVRDALLKAYLTGREYGYKYAVDKVCDILNHYCNRTGVHPSRRVDIINHIRKAMEE